MKFREELSAGRRHLLVSPVLRAATVSTVIAMLALGISESVFFAVVDYGLGRPVEFIGVLAAVQGVGAITAGVLVTAIIRRTGELRPTSIGLALMSLGCLLTISSELLLVGAGVLLFGAGLPVVIVCLTTTLQRRTPGHLQGRVFAAFELLAGAPQLLSILTGAFLVTVVDYRIPLIVMGIGIAVSSLYAAVRLREATGGGPTSHPSHQQPREPAARADAVPTAYVDRL